MTERLYYNDSYVKEFDAAVISCEPEGDRWKIVLDRTAFYPTSGGQPHDLGTLGAARIVQVDDAESHIVHYASAAVPLGPVRGLIDWARRFDHMQQHTAQHLLSAAFIELFKVQTISFHLGAEICTIDLKAASLSQTQLDLAERRTNEIIFEDRVVAVTFGTAEELAAAGVRKTVDREGVLRAVDVEGFDRQPCGGTHLARTGQAGLILLRGMERRRDAVRVEFVAGYRALAVARADFATLTQAAAALTCGLLEVPAVVAKLNEERRVQHSAVKRLEDRLAEHEAAALIAASTGVAPAGKSRVIATVLDEATPAYLSLLGAKIMAHLASKAGAAAAGGDGAPSLRIALASRATGHVMIAQPKGGSADMGAILRESLQKFPGKGGGGKDVAQAVLTDPAQAAVFVDYARAALAN